MTHRRLALLTLAVLALHGLALLVWLPPPREETPLAVHSPLSGASVRLAPAATTPTAPATAADIHPPRSSTASPTPVEHPQGQPRAAPLNLAQTPNKPAPSTAAASRAGPDPDATKTAIAAPPAAKPPVPSKVKPPASAPSAVSAAAEAPNPGEAEEPVYAAQPHVQPGRPSARPMPPLVLPSSTTLRYAVTAQRKGLDVQADATLELVADSGRYSARLTLQAWLAGSRVQTSRGSLHPTWGFVPERFGDKNRSKAEQAAHFERDRQPPVVRFSGNAPDAELPPGAQDRLSVLLQLAALLEGRARQNPSHPVTAGEQLRLPTAGTDGLEWWNFQVVDRATLQLPAGPFEALHLRRDTTHPYDNRVELWMAPALGHLPVRVRWQQANGDVVDQQLASKPTP